MVKMNIDVGNQRHSKNRSHKKMNLVKSKKNCVEEHDKILSSFDKNDGKSQTVTSTIGTLSTMSDRMSPQLKHVGVGTNFKKISSKPKTEYVDVSSSCTNSQDKIPSTINIKNHQTTNISPVGPMASFNSVNGNDESNFKDMRQYALLAKQIENQPGKMIAQNLNNTYALIGIPSNEAEIQLFRVLQRANLLKYFDVMIELGGDDVQQLCEAGEEEFLEIMALIGMATKPLHVRRLQKSLQEWATQPHLFNNLPISGTCTSARAETSSSKHVLQTPPSFTNTLPIRPTPCHPMMNASPLNLSAFESKNLKQIKNSNETYETDNMSDTSSQSTYISNAVSTNPSTANNNNNSINNTGYVQVNSEQIIPSHFLEQKIRTLSEPSSPASSIESPHPDSRTSLSPILGLQEIEVIKLYDAAHQILQKLPVTISEPRTTTKKKFFIDYENIIRMHETDIRKLEEIRRASAVYGRSDCKRKVQKPLTMHELSVNEAAAQLCKLVPALLTRRDELVPLARQVVRDSGLPYATYNSSFSFSHLTNNIVSNNNNYSKVSNKYNNKIWSEEQHPDSSMTPAKRPKLHSDNFEEEKIHTESGIMESLELFRSNMSRHTGYSSITIEKQHPHDLTVAQIRKRSYDSCDDLSNSNGSYDNGSAHSSNSQEILSSPTFKSKVEDDYIINNGSDNGS